MAAAPEDPPDVHEPEAPGRWAGFFLHLREAGWPARIAVLSAIYVGAVGWRAFVGWLMGRPRSPLDRYAGSAFVIFGALALLRLGVKRGWVK